MARHSIVFVVPCSACRSCVNVCLLHLKLWPLLTSVVLHFSHGEGCLLLPVESCRRCLTWKGCLRRKRIHRKNKTKKKKKNQGTVIILLIIIIVCFSEWNVDNNTSSIITIALSSVSSPPLSSTHYPSWVSQSSHCLSGYHHRHPYIILLGTHGSTLVNFCPHTQILQSRTGASRLVSKSNNRKQLQELRGPETNDHKLGWVAATLQTR